MNDQQGRYAVLFVDDEEMSRKYFARALGGELQVLTAGSVAEARELLEEHSDRIAVLVTDQRMPGGSGVELLRHAHTRYPHVVRLLTTAYSDLDEAIEAVNRGEIFRYLTKPWDLDRLQMEIEQAFELFRLRRERELLLAEKLTARTRLLWLGRARDLLLLAAGLPLRGAVAAVAALLRDALSAAPADDPGAGGDELGEISRGLALAAAVRERIEGGDEIGPVALAAPGTPAHITGDSSLLRRLLETLAAYGDLTVKTDEDGGVRLRAAAPSASPFDAAGEPSPLAELISVYLICHHHGGTVERSGGELLLRLPAAPVDPAGPPPYWLDDLLARFEP